MWIGWLALVLFGLRALVPVGFEPGTHATSIVLCHEGFPAGFFSHGKARHGAHGAGSASTAHCLFCNGTSPAPPYQLASLIQHVPYTIGLVLIRSPSLRLIRLTHTPQARAPPPQVRS